MWKALTNWPVVGVVVPLLIATGIGVLSMAHPGYKIAYVCFTLAASIIFIRVGWWLFFEYSGSKFRSVILACLVFGFIGSLWFVSIKWVKGLQTQSREYVAQQEKELINKPTLREIFDKDFDNLLKHDRTLEIGVQNPDGTMDTPVEITEKIYRDFAGKSQFLGYYIPQSPNAYVILYKYLPDASKMAIKEMDLQMDVISGHVTDSRKTASRDLVFSGRIYIYHENDFSLQRLAALERLYESKGLSVIFRGQAYLFTVWQSGKLKRK